MSYAEYCKSVGMEIRVARIRRGFTIEQLAKLSGISKACLFSIETGRYGMRLSSLKSIADGLGISVKDIV